MTTATDSSGYVHAAASPAYLNRSPTAYLDGVASEFAQIKTALLDLLAPAPGARVLDAGCGTGVDVFALAERVGQSGKAVGVDLSEELVTQANGRSDGSLPVEFQQADATALPFEDGVFDAVRSERVLQHIPEPLRAVKELLRVTAPGGRILAADPDHGMWAVDMSDQEVTEKLMTWRNTNIKNPWIGRRLPGMLRDAGVRDVGADVIPIVFTTLAAADAVLALSKSGQWAAAAGVIDADTGRAWHDELVRRDDEGRFLMLGAMVVAYGHKADGTGN